MSTVHRAVVGLAGATLAGLLGEVRKLRVGEPLRKEEAIVDNRACHLVGVRGGAAPGRRLFAEKATGVVWDDRVAG